MPFFGYLLSLGLGLLFWGSVFAQGAKVELQEGLVGDGGLTVDLYRPSLAVSDSWPVIVWATENGAVDQGSVAWYASRGFAVVVPRLAGDTQTKVQTLKTTVRWVRSVSFSFQLDALRIFVFGQGHSGALAAYVLWTDGVSQYEGSSYGTFSSRVTGGVLVGGEFFGPDVSSLVGFMRRNSAPALVFHGSGDRAPASSVKSLFSGWSMARVNPATLFWVEGESSFRLEEVRSRSLVWLRAIK